jgi:hypothetical protein
VAVNGKLPRQRYFCDKIKLVGVVGVLGRCYWRWVLLAGVSGVGVVRV